METYPYSNIAISWTESKTRTTSIAICFGFAVLTALSAQLRIELFFTPVPITAQTFMVILSGLLLGKKYGSLSMFLYLSGGLIGLPWFSGSVGGLAILKSPTIGYLIGFVVASWVIGQLSRYPYISILAGTFTIYWFGAIGLSLVLNISIIEAIQIGIIPFLIGDFIKAIIAFGVAKKVNI
tara:strand:- start:507 stop:1049 length:543 start_codon:yes stop_codon:yes gene_type:complete